jgi:hypothetical protein
MNTTNNKSAKKPAAKPAKSAVAKPVKTVAVKPVKVAAKKVTVAPLTGKALVAQLLKEARSTRTLIIKNVAAVAAEIATLPKKRQIAAQAALTAIDTHIAALGKSLNGAVKATS